MAVIALLLSALIVAADQLFKLLVVQKLPLGKPRPVIPGVFDLVYTQNTGAAFSILEGKTHLFIAVTIIICALIIFAMFRYRNHSFFSWAASILIVGGGVGNLIDRLTRSFVVDYLRLSFFPAIFNFGDFCVTIGAVFFIIHIFFFADQDNHAEKVIRTR
ncbi:MAG: signal peptidase II [Oscillospiraceae bacterium]|nr:signal peptidase II [Oscillospiraceae bacterium]